MRDRPLVGLSALLLGVVLHAVTSLWWPWMNPYKAFPRDANISNSITIFLGVAAASAIIAGFAGVVLVFAIGSPAKRIRQFRTSAGKRLQDLWIVVVAEPFVATLLSLMACVTQMTSGKVIAPWILEAGLVLLAHSAARILWLLRELVQIVAADDIEIERDDNSISVDDIFPN